MATTKTKSKKRVLRVGNRVRFPFGADEVEALVIEDRGNLGVGGRQIVRVRILGREDFTEPTSPANFEDGNFELPAEYLTLVK